MQHPLEFIPNPYRKRIFFTLLSLTLILFGVFSVLDIPLQTPAAPNGVVSFELARTVSQANAIASEWKRSSLLLSAVAGHANPDIVNSPYVLAAFGLGLDYLFMPVYAFALALGTLLAAGQHGGWLKSSGQWQVTGRLPRPSSMRWKITRCSRSCWDACFLRIPNWRFIVR